METIVSGGVAAGEGLPGEIQTSTISRWIIEVTRGCQRLLDKWNPHARNRWIASSVLAMVYAVRVLYLQGFFVITYALGIYLLNLLVGFLSPQFGPDVDEGEGPSLPTRSSDEFRPFVRRLPEFKFWYSFTRAFSIALVLTFFSVLDVPVFWPILLIYWATLFIITMRKHISHMIKHKYVPFSFGKKTYGKTSSPSAENAAS